MVAVKNGENGESRADHERDGSDEDEDSDSESESDSGNDTQEREESEDHVAASDEQAESAEGKRRRGRRGGRRNRRGQDDAVNSEGAEVDADADADEAPAAVSIPITEGGAETESAANVGGPVGGPGCRRGARWRKRSPLHVRAVRARHRPARRQRPTLRPNPPKRRHRIRGHKRSWPRTSQRLRPQLSPTPQLKPRR